MSAARKNRSSSEDEDMEPLPARSRNPLVWISRFMRTLLILLIVFYSALLLISRTDGFRSLVEDRYSKKWNMPFTLTQVRLAPDLALEMRGLVTKGFEQQKGTGASIEWILFNWTWARLFSWGTPAWADVQAREILVSAQRDASGQWVPSFFSEWFQMLGAGLNLPMPEQTSGPTLFPWAQTRITLESVQLFGWDDQSRILMALRDGQLSADTFEAANREIRYYRIEADLVTTPGGDIKDWSKEWLFTGGRRIDLHP